MVDHLKKDIEMAKNEIEAIEKEAQTEIEEAEKEIKEATENDEDIRKRIEEAEKRKVNAKKFLEEAQQSCLKFEDDDDKFTEEDGHCIRIAALCHDLGHGPFSHLFESVAKKMIEREDVTFKHEKMSKLIFKKILLDNPTVLANFVRFGLTQSHVEIIEDMIGVKDTEEDDESEEKKQEENKEGEKTQSDKKKKGVNRPKRKFHYEVVANKILSGMDVDKWDYFARDCHYLGIGNDFDSRRTKVLSRLVEVKEGNGRVTCKKDHRNGYHIGFRDKQADNILRMYWTRSTLHQKAYQHPTGNGVELMIRDILLKMMDVKFIGIEKEERSQTASDIVETISIKDAVDRTLENQARLSGYIALSDTLLDRIYYLANKKYSLRDSKAPSEMSNKEAKAQEEVPKEEAEEARKIIKEARDLITRLKKRDLYKHVSELEVSIPFGDEYNMEGIKLIVEKLLRKDKFCEFLARKEEFKNNKGKWKEDFEIQYVAIKFASEDNPDPLRDIFFYEKNAKRDDALSMFDKISDINKPKAYVEYKLRFYSKISNEEETPKEMESIKEQFKIWSTIMKDQLLKEKVWFGYNSFSFNKDKVIEESVHGLSFQITALVDRALSAKEKVIIRTAITCEHTAPSGYELVSGVYSISTTASFPVKIEIEHRCLSDNICLGELKAYKSPIDDFLYYKFESLEGEPQEDRKFSLDTKLTENITIGNPLIVGVFGKDIKCSYRAHLLLSEIVPARSWNIYLVITKDTEIMKECVRKFSKEKKAVVLPDSPIEFLDLNEQKIELQSETGQWNLQPCTVPIIKRQEVDFYAGHGLIPHCHLYLTYSGDDFKYCYELKLNGANHISSLDLKIPRNEDGH